MVSKVVIILVCLLKGFLEDTSMLCKYVNSKGREIEVSSKILLRDTRIMTTLPTISPTIDDLNWVKFIDKYLVGNFTRSKLFFRKGSYHNMVSMDALG